MANARKSKANYVTRGYGQVEANHLSGRYGQIYAQLPAASTIDVLEQGQFVKYDYPNKVCNFTGKGEWLLVYNEIKIYDERETDEDFAMKREDYVARIYNAANEAMPKNTVMTPRLFKTNENDIFTTNTVNFQDGEPEMVGGVLCVGDDGYLTEEAHAGSNAGTMRWQIVKIYTLPDGQKAVKLMRIA